MLLLNFKDNRAKNHILLFTLRNKNRYNKFVNLIVNKEFTNNNNEFF